MITGLVKAVVFLLVVSLASKWLFQLFDKYVVDNIFVIFYKPHLTAFETILSTLAAFYVFYLFANRVSNTGYKIHSTAILVSSWLAYVYFQCRHDETYRYTRIYEWGSSDGIALLDMPFIILGLVVVILIINILQIRKGGRENDLVLDIPLHLIEDDEYDRKEVYEGLLKQIAEIDFREKKSFCLGIANSWGDGKTSFLNFLEERLLAEEDTIVVKFNAWLSTNSDNLTIDFFQTFNNELSKFVSTGSNLRSYAHNLTAINSPYNPFKYLPNSWIGDKSHQAAFDDINELVEKTGKKIFVFVDDIDRLDNKEVFNLLRTVRNTANFGGVHFIVPFDKLYVLNAITENKIYRPEEYLKKIFDVELALPPISKGVTQAVFYKLFEKLFDILQTTEIQKENFLLQLRSLVYDSGYATSHRSKYSIINFHLFKLLKNKRDVIRFYNSLALTIKTNYKWAYLPDLFILELLKICDAGIIRMLFENDHYLDSKSDSSRRQYYSLKTSSSNNGTEDAFVTAIYKRRGDYKMEDKNLSDDVKELISELFKLPEEDDFMAEYGIVYQTNFANYFQHRENGVKFNDIEELLNG